MLKMVFAALCCKRVFSFFFANSKMEESKMDIKSMSKNENPKIELEKKTQFT